MTFVIPHNSVQNNTERMNLMKIEITMEGSSAHTNGLRSYIQRRVHSVFNRFADRIASIKIRIAEFNEPRLGRQNESQIRVKLFPSALLITQTTRLPDVYAAVDHATDCIGRFFSQQFERESASHDRTMSLRDVPKYEDAA
jgi:hypothetical protein